MFPSTKFMVGTALLALCLPVKAQTQVADAGLETVIVTGERTEVDVPNPAGTLLPGSYAEVHFDVKVTAQRLSLPVNALLFRPDGTMAAVVGPDSRINLKKLTIGRDYGNTLEVLQGIDPADRIVVNPPDSLEQNQLVNVAAQDAAGTTPPHSAQPTKP